MKICPPALVVLLFALVLMGCNQYSASSYENPAATPTPTPTTTAEVSLANEVQPIFNSNCTSCHPSNGGLSLSSGSSYSNLVNVVSQGYAPNLRVKPSDEANSVLVKKIEGASGFGNRMPQGGAALSSANIQKIKDWINQGAKNN